MTTENNKKIFCEISGVKYSQEQFDKTCDEDWNVVSDTYELNYNKKGKCIFCRQPLKYIKFIYNKKVNKTCQCGRTCCNTFIKNDVYEKFKKNRYLQKLKKKYNLEKFEINKYLQDTLKLLNECIKERIKELENKICDLPDKIRLLNQEKKDISTLINNFNYDLKEYIDIIDEKIKAYKEIKRQEEEKRKRQEEEKRKRQEEEEKIQEVKRKIQEVERQRQIIERQRQEVERKRQIIEREREREKEREKQEILEYNNTLNQLKIFNEKEKNKPIKKNDTDKAFDKFINCMNKKKEKCPICNNTYCRCEKPNFIILTNDDEKKYKRCLKCQYNEHICI
jgi:hypothetical protein